MPVLALFTGKLTKAQYDTLRNEVDWENKHPEHRLRLAREELTGDPDPVAGDGAVVVGAEHEVLGRFAKTGVPGERDAPFSGPNRLVGGGSGMQNSVSEVADRSKSDKV